MTSGELQLIRAQQNANASRMRALKGLDEWRAYVAHLDGRIMEETERLVQGKVEQFDYLKGLIEGLRMAKALPDLVIAHAEAGRAREV